MTWTTERLRRLVVDLAERRGDTATVEVKAAIGGCPSLGETLCAFGNMPEGGTIILGLDGGDGFQPTGIEDVAALEQGVAAQARTAVAPPLHCEFTTVDLDGARVLVCDVDPLPLEVRPARHRGHAFLRQSDGDYALSQQELAQLELLKTQASRPTHPDRRPITGTSRADLDPELTSSYLSALRSASRRHASVDDAEILRRSGVLTAHGEATLAGLYVLGTYPQQHLPHLTVTAAVRLPRSSGGRTLDLVTLTGPLPEQLDDAMAWVRRNTASTLVYDADGHARDRDELPMTAVREVVANALVHRNLDLITENKGIDIRLIDDGLVITSPGGLWGVSERQLGDPGARSAVNSTLYEICKYTRLTDRSRVIEGEGGGIRETLLAVSEAGLPTPRFRDTSLRFTALLARRKETPRAGASAPPAVRTLSANAAAVWTTLREPHTLTALAEVTGLNTRQVRYAVDRLRGAGYVTMEGKHGARNTRYRRTEGPSE